VITFRCPSCQRIATAPPDRAGQKTACECGARVQIPGTPPPAKTVLGEVVQGPPPFIPPSTPTSILPAIPHGFRCTLCGSAARPDVETRIPQAAWIVFVLLMFTVVGLLVCWIPLVAMREEKIVCARCGAIAGDR